VVLGALIGTPACLRGQPSDNQLGDLLKPKAGAPAAAGMPTADQAMGAYQTVERWVRAWAEPQAAECSASGVRVGIYQRGLLIGWGAARAEAAGERGALGEAAAGAMAMAAGALVPKADALAAEQLRAVAGDLMVSLELAGPMTPLAEMELGNPDGVIRPGLDGLAVRVGGEWAVAYPSEILAGGAAAGVRLPAMAARLLGDASLGIGLPVDLAREHGAAFYRFETLQVAGAGLGGSAVFVQRGGSVVEASGVTTASLAGFAEEMLGHFESGMLEGGGRLGLRGPLDAARGVAEPPVGTPMQQSLAALALVRLAETPGVSEGARSRAGGLARRIMQDLAVVEPIERAVGDDGVAAAVAWVVLARLGAEGDPELGGLYATCEEMLSRHAAAEREEVLPTVSNAVLVWAMAERAAVTGWDGAVAERDLRAISGGAQPGEVVGLMPWLGWAELRLSGEASGRAALRALRERVWEHQLSGLDTGLAERDMAGGVVFTRGFASLPTWSTARPVALCATMLGDPRLTTDAEAPGEVVRLVGAFRFLRQLSAREVECAFYPRADLARGGVRAAVWDPRMPPEATAMTMLAVCEFLASLEALEARSEPAGTPVSR
jgi:hypothetical protein